MRSAQLLTTALALVAAAGVAGRWTGPVAAQQAGVPEIDGRAAQTLDEQLLEMARRDPAFGGMFVDAEGRLTMYVTDSALAAQDGRSRLATMSVDAVTTFRGNEQIAEAAATRRINVLPAQYSFGALYDWHRAVTSEVMKTPGVVLTDISESTNRLRVGVETPDAANAVRRQIAALGVPSEAVAIELAAPIRRLVTVRNRFRPLIGGIQINFGFYVCTLGVPAVRAGVSGFVTNSHCTTVQGGNNNTIFHQPIASGTTHRVGIETVDPSYFTGGACPARRKCRYSDTAFVRVAHPSGPAAVTQRGYIARPESLTSLKVTTGRFRITSENSVPVLNETLHKVGRTTGWSQGKVVATCINTNVSGTTITQLCQDIVKANVNAGDSGSPVFRVTHSPARNDVRLYGVLWGGGRLSGYGTVFVFSALGSRNIQKSGEMGRLATCASGFGC